MYCGSGFLIEIAERVPYLPFLYRISYVCVDCDASYTL